MVLGLRKVTGGSGGGGPGWAKGLHLPGCPSQNLTEQTGGG